MKIVAFDESGNSGENLLDCQQPVYVLAGVCLEEQVASDFVTELLRDRQATELKFASLRKGSSGQRVVLKALRSEFLVPANRWVTVSEKGWFLAGKVIDLLIEPVTLSSAAFYESGMHQLSADWLFLQASEEVGLERWQGFLEAFVTAARSQGEDERVAVAELAERLHEIQGFEGTTTARILRPVPASVDYLSEHLSGSGAKDQLEPAVTSLVGQLEAWSKRLDEPFRVVHDDSKVIEDWVGELLRWSDPRIEPVSIESDVATFRLPLLATNIEFATSETTPAIQLSDLIAGAASWWLKDSVAGTGEDDFAAEIRDAGLRADWVVGSLAFQEQAFQHPAS
jgi:hypothetical protein